MESTKELIAGRQSELNSLLKALAEGRQGSALICSVVGEFGAGKTTLMKALRCAAEKHGDTTVELRCTSTEGRVQFSLIRQLVAKLRSRKFRNDDEFFEVGEKHPTAFATLGPAQVSLRIDAATEALRELLVWATREAPLVITIDDCHMADASSLTTLSCLLRWERNIRLLLVVAMTEGEPAQAPTELYNLPIQAPPVVLSRLAKADTAMIVRQALGNVADHVVAELYAATAGNPLFLRAVLRRLANQEPHPRGATAMAVKVVGSCIYNRISRVSLAAAKLARAAALLGPESATLSATAGLAGLRLKDAADAAEYLIKAKVLHNTEILTFRRPVQSEGILGQLSAIAHGAARLEAAQYLHSINAPTELIAKQLIKTGALNPFPWATEVLRSAANKMRTHNSYGDAVRYLEHAARGALGPELEGIEVELADTQIMVDLPSAIDYLVGIMMKGGDGATRHDILLRLGYAVQLCDNPRRGVQVLNDLARLPSSSLDGEAGAWARLNLLYIEMSRGPDEGVRRETEMLLQSAANGSQDPCGALIALMAFLDYVTNHSPVTAVALAEKAVKDPNLIDLSNPFPAMATLSVMAYCGKIEKAYELAQSWLSSFRHKGRALNIAAFELTCGILANMRGHYRSAECALRETLATFDRHGVWRGQPLYLSATAAFLDTLISMGELTAARKLLNDGGLAGEMADGWCYLNILLQRARLKVASGDLPGALADLQGCAKRSNAFGIVRQEVVPWRSHTVLVLHRLGRRSEALQLFEQDLEEARHGPSPLALGRALLAAGVVVGGTEGIHLLREATKVLEDSAADGLLTIASCELGILLQKDQQYEAAQDVLTRTIRLAKHCGATPVGDLARQRLTAASTKQRHAATITGLMTLTAQERRVLREALRGQSNASIAEVMHVTRRTVELHLSSSYRKLGIDGRKEFAKVLADQELWSVLGDE